MIDDVVRNTVAGAWIGARRIILSDPYVENGE
jgi:hypothetical protein